MRRKKPFSDNLLQRNDNQANLWVNEPREGLPREAVRLMIKRLCRRAGVKGVKLGPHAFRHAFAAMAIRNGANVFYVQELLGHSTLTMTRRYASTIDSEEAIKARDQFSPADRLLGGAAPRANATINRTFDATQQMVAAAAAPPLWTTT